MYEAWSDASFKKTGLTIIGYTIHNNDEEIIKYVAKAVKCNNSHEGEFIALLALLERLNRLNISNCNVYCDSTSIVGQIRGDSNAHDSYQYYVEHINELLQEGNHNLHWTQRKYNKADRLCKYSKIKNVYLKQLPKVKRYELGLI